MFSYFVPNTTIRIKPPKRAPEPTFRLPTPSRKEMLMKKIAYKCLECNTISAHSGDGHCCPACSGCITPIGHFVESNKNEITVSVKADGLHELEKQLKRIRGLTVEIPDFTVRKQKYIVSCEGMRGGVTFEALKKFGEETVDAIKRGDIAVIPRGFKLTILNEDGTSTVIG